ncbi:MAG: hypothetical protein J6C27_07470 [Clostridia bacterium]|nr:hypothetical protein [Clostridia bacterium]
MKHLNKLLAFLMAMLLIVSFVACNKKNNNTNTQGDNSKPTVSTPSGNNTTESKPKEDKQEESKPVENNQEPSTPSKPVEPDKPIVTVKPANELILGKWKTKVDVCEILVQNNIELVGPIYIDVITNFQNDLSYSADISYTNATNVLKAALPDYDDNFIDNCVNIISDALFESGIYKFEDDKLFIMLDIDPDYTEIEYSFTNSNNSLVLSFSSDEREYERVN